MPRPVIRSAITLTFELATNEFNADNVLPDPIQFRAALIGAIKNGNIDALFVLHRTVEDIKLVN